MSKGYISKKILLLQLDELDMTDLENMKRKLREEIDAKNPIYSGNYGEQVAILHFEETKQPFIHVHQEKWSKPLNMVALGAKRPDFYLLPLDDEINMIDAKYHTLGEQLEFTLSESELQEYLFLFQYVEKEFNRNLDKINLDLFIIPKEYGGLAYARVSLREIINHKKMTPLNCPKDFGEIYSTYYSIPIKDRLTKIFTIDEKFTA